MLTFICSIGSLTAQEERAMLEVKKARHPILVDGIPDPLEWSDHQVYSHFTPNFPNSTDSLEATTEVRLTYDDINLYVVAVMKLPAGSQGYNVQSLQRDFNLRENEAFLVILDTYADYTNGYYFEVTPHGNKGELLAANSGRFQGVNASWEKPWLVKTSRSDSSWVAEMAIPFRILKYKPGEKSWRINFARIDKTSNQYSSWAPVPRNFDIWDLNFTGRLDWDQGLPGVKTKPNILPSITMVSERTGDSESAQLKIRPSLDFNTNIGQSLNLDVTLNPDFSQAEVDRQQINLDRFELFFPERRQFFIENEDLFSSYGFVPLRPFFSRRIGLVFDPATGTYRSTRILAGLRLSGKLNNRLRVGLLSVQTAEEEAFFMSDSGGFSDLPSINYTVLSLQQQFKGKSNLKVLMVNKSLAKSTAELNKWNRTLSLQYNFTSAGGRYYGWAFASGSFTEGSEGNGLSVGTSMVYNVRKWQVLFSARTIGENYNAEAGFVRRKGVSEFFINPAYRYYPGGVFAENRLGISSTIFQDEQFNNLDNSIGLFHQSFFRSGNSIRLQYNFEHTRLRADFDPSGINDELLTSGSEFDYQNMEVSFVSNRRASFWYEFDVSTGKYFNGSRFQANATLNYRLQPYVNLNLQVSKVRVKLPAPYSSGSFYVVTPAIQTSLSKSLFINLVGQYSEQFDSLNLNFRLQWRFKPVSDIFLIYAANHEPVDWGLKGRAITVKINYLL